MAHFDARAVTMIEYIIEDRWSTSSDVPVQEAPAKYKFDIYRETAERIGEFQKAHPEQNTNEIVNRAIYHGLEEAEHGLKQS